MRRLVVLTMLAFFPAAVSAAPAASTRAGRSAAATKKKAAKRTVPKRASPPSEEVPVPAASAPAAEAAVSGTSEAAPVSVASDAPRVDAPTLTPPAGTADPASRLFGEPVRRSSVHRYAFVAGGVAAATGAAFGYWAKGETRRAQSIGSAAESRRVLDGAKRTAATASLLYGVAAASVLYGLAIEFLPQKVADKASLTYHF